MGWLTDGGGRVRGAWAVVSFRVNLGWMYDIVTTRARSAECGKYGLLSDYGKNKRRSHDCDAWISLIVMAFSRPMLRLVGV